MATSGSPLPPRQPDRGAWGASSTRKADRVPRALLPTHISQLGGEGGKHEAPRLPMEQPGLREGASGMEPESPQNPDLSLCKTWVLRPRPWGHTPAWGSGGATGLVGKSWETEAAGGEGRGHSRWRLWGVGVGAWGCVALLQVSLFFCPERSPCIHLKLGRACRRGHWRGS